MKNGVYDKWVTINRSVCGTADKPINLVAESISTDGTLSRTANHLITVMQEEMMQMDLQQN